MDTIILTYHMTIYDTDTNLNLIKLSNNTTNFNLPRECFNFSFTLNDKIIYQVKERDDGTRYFIVSPIKDI